MQVNTALRPQKVVPIAPAARVRPTPRVLNGAALLEAMGDLALAADRRSLTDLLGAWRRLCEGAGRPECLRVTPPFPPVPLPLAPDRVDGWTHLTDLAWAACRNVRALDADRHWRAAAHLFQQAAANAAALNGWRVASDLAAWRRDGWRDLDELADGPVDGAPMTDIAVDLLASLASQAAHFAHIALGEGVGAWDAASRAEHAARTAVQDVITEALRALDLQHVSRDPFSTDDGDTVTTCEVCGGVEGCTRQCPAVVLSAHHLIGVYADALNGGAR